MPMYGQAMSAGSTYGGYQAAQGGGSMFGASLGLNFINKGIDQFTYGVSEEYSRYAREKSREWQVQDFPIKVKQAMDLAKKYGIHPLVMLGAAGVGGSSSIPPITSSPPSGGGNPISGSRDQDALTKAQARLTNAQAEQLENMNKLGQDPIKPGTIEQFAEHSTGVMAGYNPQMKYEQTPEGYWNLIARDNEAYSDEAPVTTQAFFLWDDLARRKFGDTIYRNWNDPKFQYRKKLWLQSRPRNRKGKINLWVRSRGQWREFDLTPENKGHVFSNTKVIKRRKNKQKPVNYQNIPLS